MQNKRGKRSISAEVEREGRGEQEEREKRDCQVALSWSKICVALPQF